MSEPDAGLEDFWDNILSGESARVQAAFQSLDEVSQEAVLRHLQKMASEEGWHPLQQKTARAALEILMK